MERKLAAVILLAVGLGVGLAVGAFLAPGGEPIPGRKPRDWFDVADITLRVSTLVVFTGGLVGTFAVLTNLRASTYAQIHSRFQTTLLKLAEHPEWFDGLRRDEYTAEEDDPTNPTATARPHRFVANAMINMYEEAFLLYEARVLAVFDTMTDDYWQSMLGSMRAAFRLKYVRTQWEMRQAVFSSGFNKFVREQVLDKK